MYCSTSRRCFTAIIRQLLLPTFRNHRFEPTPQSPKRKEGEGLLLFYIKGRPTVLAVTEMRILELELTVKPIYFCAVDIISQPPCSSP
jgi:hypothetical protein